MLIPQEEIIVYERRKELEIVIGALICWLCAQPAVMHYPQKQEKSHMSKIRFHLSVDIQASKRRRPANTITA
jgi:hypothetical protein